MEGLKDALIVHRQNRPGQPITPHRHLRLRPRRLPRRRARVHVPWAGGGLLINDVAAVRSQDRAYSPAGDHPLLSRGATTRHATTPTESPTLCLTSENTDLRLGNDNSHQAPPDPRRQRHPDQGRHLRKPGRLRSRPNALLGEEGYDSNPNRRELRRRRILPVISPQGCPEHQGPGQAPLRRRADVLAAAPLQAPGRPLGKTPRPARGPRPPCLRPHLMETPKKVSP